MNNRRRKCRGCEEWYLPQPHNAYHQRYCTAPACRKKSKRASQRKWLRKNPGQHSGRANVFRVQTWRERHPGYWRIARPAHHLRLDLFLPPTRLRSPARLRAEHLRTGALQELSLPYRAQWQQVASILGTALRELIGECSESPYVFLPATGG